MDTLLYAKELACEDLIISAVAELGVHEFSELAFFSPAAIETWLGGKSLMFLPWRLLIQRDVRNVLRLTIVNPCQTNPNNQKLFHNKPLHFAGMGNSSRFFFTLAHASHLL